jgi:hypothetical protein
MRCLTVVALLIVLPAATRADEPLPPIPPIARLLPPEGEELPQEEKARLEERLAAIEKRLAPLRQARLARQERLSPLLQDRLLPDVEIFTKAVRYAIDLHEFYNVEKDVAKAHKLLDEAEKRLSELERGTHSWTVGPGCVVRGYQSGIDDSVQPYGVVFPEGFDLHAKLPYPIYIWLHGRGDKSTDLHFIHERMTQAGQLGPVDGIVLHPFGRQCVGFKWAGEVDVIRSWSNFTTTAHDEKVPMDVERKVLIGFSMGGAGAWHCGAHYVNHYDAIAPGAGFAETARYTKTDPASVPWYERKLWGLYDVPCYTRNLFNTRVIAYSGENDKQIQAARVMEEAFKTEGRQLTHLIGPGVEHKYEPETLKTLKQEIKTALASARPNPYESNEVSLQTRTLRYDSIGWVHAERLERHWEDSRIDAAASGEKEDRICKVATKGIAAFSLTQNGFKQCIVDGQSFSIGQEQYPSVAFEKRDGKWQNVERFQKGLFKRPKLQGPIDDAFMDSFIVVTPSGKSSRPQVQRWVDFELRHFLDRWRGLMRGEPRVKMDSEITAEDIRDNNLICFGDPESNSIIRRSFEKLPVTWKGDSIVAGQNRWSAGNNVPLLVYPNPLAQEPEDFDISGLFRKPIKTIDHWTPKYLVINSGLTFREAHDKTNSQQNPKLPDWAVIDLSQLPDDKAPGRIAAAGFFDEEWKYQDHSDE